MESKAASKSAANNIPDLFCCSEYVIISDMSRIGSPMYLPLTKADCSSPIKEGRTLFNRVARILLKVSVTLV